MTPELQKYYEYRFDMFATQGWRDLIEDLKGMRAASDTLSGATPENLGFRQGEISIMDWLLGLESVSNETYEQLKGEDENPA